MEGQAHNWLGSTKFYAQPDRWTVHTTHRWNTNQSETQTDTLITLQFHTLTLTLTLTLTHS